MIRIKMHHLLPVFVLKTFCLSIRIHSEPEAAGGAGLFRLWLESEVFCGSGGHWLR